MISVYKIPVALICFSSVSAKANDTLIETNLTWHQAADRHPSFSPGGKQIVFESDRSGKWGIYMMNADGANISGIVCDSFNNRIPSFHPDGKTIVFESDRSGKYQLYGYNIRLKQITKLIAFDKFEYTQQFGTWSSDGKYLAFCSSIDGTPEKLNIYLFHLKTGNIKNITPDTLRSLYPAWADNSKEIIFFSRKDTKGKDDELYKMKIKTLWPTRLTYDTLNNFCPAWLPGKDRVVYVQSMNEQVRPELFMLKLKSGEKKRLTFNNDGDTEPVISPDGKTLAWTAFRNGNFEIVKADIPALKSIQLK